MIYVMGFLGRLLARVLRWLSPKSRQICGYALGGLWFDVLKIRRQIVLENIKIAFPDLDDQARIELGQRAMRNFGLNLMEYCFLPVLPQMEWRSLFQAEGFENLSKAQREGRGVLILSLHLGNYDLGLAGLSLAGFPVCMISKEFKTRWLNDLWFGVRAKSGIRFIPPRNSSYAVLKGLKRGQLVFFVHDQFTGPPIGVKSTFFGKETGTGLGLALMAERSKAPVCLAYTFRQEDGRHRIVVTKPIAFDDLGDRDRTLAHMTQKYNDLLEAIVRSHPDQWMWLHRRWKEFKY